MAELAWQDIEHTRLVRLCATISGDRDAAEDLAQETLLEAWRHRHKLTDPDGADRWLAAIARNVCLRWGRARGRLPVPVADVPEPAPPPEDRIGELLELLPPGARDVLVERYVHDRSHGEIAAALGISGDAVAMRLTRSKHALRRMLEAAEWHPSELACPLCGHRTLLMRRDASEIAFTCPGCAPGGILTRYPLDNPQFARLVGGVVRPSAMLRRVGDWASGYFAGGDGTSAVCTRCGGAVTLRAHRRPCGLQARCAACGEDVWSALTGLAAALPAVRELGRLRLVGVREERGTVAVRHAAVDGTRTMDVGFDGTTYALLGVA